MKNEGVRGVDKCVDKYRDKCVENAGICTPLTAESPKRWIMHRLYTTYEASYPQKQGHTNTLRIKEIRLGRKELSTYPQPITILFSLDFKIKNKK